MLGWLFASPAEARLLGQERLRGPDALGDRDHELLDHDHRRRGTGAGEHRRRARERHRGALFDPDPGRRGRIDDLLAAVRSAPGRARTSQAVPEAEMRRTLERWLGPAAQSADLPVPALINFDLEPERRLRRASASGCRRSLPDAHDRGASRSCRPAAPLASRCCNGSRSALSLLLERRGRGRGRARGARRARHPSLHDRGDARHRRDRRPGHPPVPAQDCDRCARSAASPGRCAAAIVLLLLGAGAAFAGELTGGATLLGHRSR